MNRKEKLLSNAQNAHVIGGALLLFRTVSMIIELIIELLGLLLNLNSDYNMEYLINPLLYDAPYLFLLAAALIFIISKRSSIVGFISIMLTLTVPIITMFQIDGIHDQYDIYSLIVITANIFIIVFTGIYILLSAACRNKRLKLLDFWFIFPCIYILITMTVIGLLVADNTFDSHYSYNILSFCKSYINMGFPLFMFGAGMGMLMFGARQQNIAYTYTEKQFSDYSEQAQSHYEHLGGM